MTPRFSAVTRCLALDRETFPTGSRQWFDSFQKRYHHVRAPGPGSMARPMHVHRGMFVQQFMSRPVVTCRPSDTLNTAAQIMWDSDCGAVPVVDDNGSLVGIVTDRDACMAAYTQGLGLAHIPVHVAMATQVRTCGPEDAIGEAERFMRTHRVRRLPVVNGDNRLVGMLSLADIARATPSAKDGVMSRELTRTLAAISQPADDRRLTPAAGDSADWPSSAPPSGGWGQTEPATA